MRLFLKVLLFILFFSTRSIHAQFDFSSFTSTSTSKISFAGGASIASNVLRLTTPTSGTGAAFYYIKQNVRDGFETNFSFSSTGGDGIVFLIQNHGAKSYNPAPAQSLGYHDVPNSLAVEFDFFNNSSEFPDRTAFHISVQSRGMFPNSNLHTYSLGAYTVGASMMDGSTINVKIIYKNNNLSIYYKNSSTPCISVTLDLNNLLYLSNGDAFIGFTAATGGSTGNNDIRTWSFKNSPFLATLISPMNLSKNIPVTQEFLWSSTNLSSVYQIQLSKDLNFSTIVNDQSGITSTSYSFSGLLPNTTYYWRVRPSSNNIAYYWSKSFIFTTGQSFALLDGLVAYFPFNGNANDQSGNGRKGTVNGATLSADRFNNINSSYTFNGTSNYISTDYSGILGDDSRSISIWFNLNGVTQGGHLLSYGLEGTGNSFRCIIDKIDVNKFAPAFCPSTGYIRYGPFTLDKNWHNIIYIIPDTSDLRLANVEIYFDGEKISKIYDQNVPSITLMTLKNQNLWIGQYMNSGFFSGSIDDIRVYNRILDKTEVLMLFNEKNFLIPSTPSLSLPANNSIGIQINPSLTWNAITGANSYMLQVSTNSNFSSYVLNQDKITSTSYSLGGLSNNTNYYWRVSSVNDAGISDWSTSFSFTTIQTKPDIPTLISPINSSSGVSRFPTLSWNAIAGADSYQLQISSDQSFSSTIKDINNITSTSYNVSGLANNSAYYWHVRAINSAGNSDWSQIWNFTTKSASQIKLDKSSLTYYAQPNGTNPGSQTITISNGGEDSLTWSVSDDVAWLDIIPGTGTNGGTVTTSINTTSLGAGTYTAKITFTASGASNTPQVVNVNYTLASVPSIVVSKYSLTFNAYQNGSTPLSQTFNISNGGSGNLNWQITKDSSWLTVTPQNGTDNGTINVGVNTTIFEPKTYTASITITAPGSVNSPQVLQINYNISKPPKINLNKKTLNFVATQNSTLPSNESITIDNSGGGELIWTVSDDAGWLDVSPTNGTNSGTLAISVNTTNLEPKAYSASIVVNSTNAENNPQVINVTYTVTSQSPKITLSKNSISFSAIQNGSKPTDETFTVSNSGGSVLNWNIVDDASWLDVSQTSGTDSKVINVSINNTNLDPKSYNATITVSASGASNSPQTLSISYTVNAQPKINLSKSSITFNVTQGGTLPAAETFTLNNSGGGSLIWSLVDDATWLDITPTNGIDTKVITASVNTSSMNPGTYNATITISGTSASNNPQTISVSYIVRPSYPSTYSLSTTILFPSYSDISAYSSSDYKLIGLPGKSDIPINSLFTGTQAKEWQVIRDNGNNLNYKVKYDGSTDFKFSVGNGFWILKTGTLTINLSSVSTAPLNTNYEVEIPLQNGWNIITNPFTTSVLWSKVQAANTITEPLWKYSKSYDNATTSMEPYNGYYFDNRNNKSILKIPLPTQTFFERRDIPPFVSQNGINNQNISFNTESSNNSIGMSLQNNIDWNVNIILSSDDFTDRTLSFGISDEANMNLDKFDFRKPRATEDVPYIFFDRSSWGEDFKYMASDMRAPFDDLQIWDFDILNKANIKKEFSLSFSGINQIPKNLDISLFDKESGREFNLRTDSTYRFIPINSLLKFSILVGKIKDIEEKKQSIMPKEYTLINYPNPFNPSTTIYITLPKATDAKLAIYNLLGKEIYSYNLGILSSGQHSVVWDGRDSFGNTQTSGVYIYKLITNSGINIFNKMLLMK